MRGLALTLAILGIAPLAAAQDVATEPAETTPVVEGEAPPSESEAEVEDASDEVPPPPPETSETPPDRPGRSHASSLPSPRARVAMLDDEIPHDPEPVAPELPDDAEVFIAYGPGAGIGLSGLSGLGALGGLEGSLLSLRTDFVFLADARNAFGIGLAVARTEMDDLFGAGSESTRVEVPLIAQLYLEDPRRGAAVPTLRIMPSFRWESSEGSSTGAWRAAAGGRLELGVGVTWFILPWLALRFLGDVGATAIVYYEGIGGNVISAFVGANVGIVIRL